MIFDSLALQPGSFTTARHLATPEVALEVEGCRSPHESRDYERQGAPAALEGRRRLRFDGSCKVNCLRTDFVHQQAFFRHAFRQT
jgi:hypothetical protein